MKTTRAESMIAAAEVLVDELRKPHEGHKIPNEEAIDDWKQQLRDFHEKTGVPLGFTALMSLGTEVEKEKKSGMMTEAALMVLMSDIIKDVKV